MFGRDDRTFGIDHSLLEGKWRERAAEWRDSVLLLEGCRTAQPALCRYNILVRTEILLLSPSKHQPLDSEPWNWSAILLLCAVYICPEVWCLVTFFFLYKLKIVKLDAVQSAYLICVFITQLRLLAKKIAPMQCVHMFLVLWYIDLEEYWFK